MLILSEPRVAALRFTRRLTPPPSHNGGGVNQDQPNVDRQYESARRVNDFQSDTKGTFTGVFIRCCGIISVTAAGAIVWVICSVIFCLVISEYFSAIVDVTGQL